MLQYYLLLLIRVGEFSRCTISLLLIHVFYVVMYANYALDIHCVQTRI